MGYFVDQQTIKLVDKWTTLIFMTRFVTIFMATDWWWLEHDWIIYLSMTIGNVIIPTDYIIFFRGVGWNHQPDKIHDQFMGFWCMSLRRPAFSRTSGELCQLLPRRRLRVGCIPGLRGTSLEPSQGREDSHFDAGDEFEITWQFLTLWLCQFILVYSYNFTMVDGR